MPNPIRMSVSDSRVRSNTCGLLNPCIEGWRCRGHPGLSPGGTVCARASSGISVVERVGIVVGVGRGESRMIGPGTNRAEEENFPEPSAVLFWVVIVRFIRYLDLSNRGFKSRDGIEWSLVSKSVEETHAALCAILVDLIP